MGLDMYLTARRFLGAWRKTELQQSEVGRIFPELGDMKIESVSASAGYWRKANAIHNWFVTYVQNGVDDCKEYYVSPEDLKVLLRTCEDVLRDTFKAEELLPTKEGFFFGGTDYGPNYWEDIEATKKICEQCLREDMKEWDFYYQSSW